MAYGKRTTSSRGSQRKMTGSGGRRPSRTTSTPGSQRKMTGSGGRRPNAQRGRRS